MAHLTVKGKDLKAKADFKAEQLASKLFGEKDEKGNDAGGFETLYMGITENSNDHLLGFWQCLLEHYGKEKPSKTEIEDAIVAQIDEDGDAEKMFKEAFEVLNEASFFKLKAKKLLKNLEMMKETGKTKEEKAENAAMHKRLMESIEALKA